VVAGVVAVAGIAILATGARWLLVPLAYGFWARMLSGPTLSPLGRLASAVIAPRLGAPRYVAGPPKRFAQGIGATLTVGALLAWLAGATGPAAVLIAMIAVAATLESLFAICLGCRLFALLMRVGVIPPEVCVACSDLSGRLAAAAPRVAHPAADPTP
jgi:uncharacterized protein DUF4395